MSHAQLMRHIRLTVEDEEFNRLEAVKGDRTWQGAMLEEFGVRETEPAAGATTDQGESV